MPALPTCSGTFDHLDEGHSTARRCALGGGGGDGVFSGSGESVDEGHSTTRRCSLDDGSRNDVSFVIVECMNVLGGGRAGELTVMFLAIRLI